MNRGLGDLVLTITSADGIRTQSFANVVEVTQDEGTWIGWRGPAGLGGQFRLRADESVSIEQVSERERA